MKVDDETIILFSEYLGIKVSAPRVEDIRVDYVFREVSPKGVAKRNFGCADRHSFFPASCAEKAETVLK
jgi:hypothetical protein